MPGSLPDRRPGSPAPADEPSPSTRETAAAFARGLQQYLAARGELLAIESREAARYTTRKAVLGTTLALCAFFAYTLILCAAVSLAGRWLESAFPAHFAKIGWQSAALLAGLLHVVASLVFVTLLRKKPAEPLFEVTRRELQKDRQWLHDQQTDNASKS